MFTILKNVKYLLFLLLFTSIKVEANNEKLALHGGYTFETSQEQRATAVYLSFLITVKKK